MEICCGAHTHALAAGCVADWGACTCSSNCHTFQCDCDSYLMWGSETMGSCGSASSSSMAAPMEHLKADAVLVQGRQHAEAGHDGAYGVERIHHPHARVLLAVLRQLLLPLCREHQQGRPQPLPLTQQVSYPCADMHGLVMTTFVCSHSGSGLHLVTQRGLTFPPHFVQQDVERALLPERLPHQDRPDVYAHGCCCLQQLWTQVLLRLQKSAG